MPTVTGSRPAVAAASIPVEQQRVALLDLRPGPRIGGDTVHVPVDGVSCEVSEDGAEVVDAPQRGCRHWLGANAVVDGVADPVPGG